MDANNFPYPVNPINIPPGLLQPSAAFKKEVSRVMGSVVLFFIVYILMFLLSIGLVVACFFGGWAIITNIQSIYGIIAGIGVIGVGLMVFIFLIKFLFAVSRYDRSGIIEISEQDQPLLFAFIRKITVDTQTKFPKKIFLSPDVNASVFYDSSFWSMFLPVRKNLQIGLGLVNTLNLSEFKAVMAHEFGHFSQRSMKLGSFVYNVNKVIYNLLYENSSYTSFLQSWANLGNIFAFFANITARIAMGIQAVLKSMYGFINKNYMGLSREMEFHADRVAASVSGSESLVTALRRIELADTGYSIVMQKCNELFREKKITHNIYANHKSVLSELSKEFRLRQENGLPVVNEEFLQQNQLSRVNYKDQWASHPTTTDRSIHLRELDISAENNIEPAWILFNDKEEIQRTLSEKIYANAPVEENMIAIDPGEFNNKLEEDMRQLSLPELYNGFYDSRQIAIPEKGFNMNENSNLELAELLSPENGALPKKIKSAAVDLEILNAIAEKRIVTKTFDFDGKKYDAGETKKIAEQLELELKEMQDRLVKLDLDMIRFFYRQAKKSNKNASELENEYSRYFDHRGKADTLFKLMEEMLGALHPIYSGQTITLEQINPLIESLKNEHETAFKVELDYWLKLGAFENDPSMGPAVQKFIDSHYVYFSGQSFMENELMELNRLCHECWDLISRYLFREFKWILERQSAIVSN